MMKKPFFAAAAAAAALLVQPVAALPGTTQYIPDASGEYVFYRDASFERESYTGFVYYDESTYGVRYYAPAVQDKKAPQAEKDIQLYFTVDTLQDHFEPTGERIAGTVTPDDTDVINYLHDMMYELTARRVKAGTVASQVTQTQDFQQFGGEVTLLFNPLVPIFNLECIKSLDGKTILQVVTTGLLSGAQNEQADTSFTDFKGFPQKLTDKEHVFKRNKKAAVATYTYSKDELFTQTVQLDSQWTQYADNFFFLGKHDALVTFDVAVQASDTTDKQDYASRLLRRFLQSNPNSYANWMELSLQKVGNRTIATLPVYVQSSNTRMQLFRVIEEQKDGSVAFFLMTVYDSIYQKNKAYFDAVVGSYTVAAKE